MEHLLGDTQPSAQWDELLSLIYGAVGEPTGWSPVFEKCCQVIGANAGGITWRSGPAIHQCWVGLPQEFNEAYVGHYHRMDPWLAPAARVIRVGDCLNGCAFTPPEALTRNEFYQDLCLRHGYVEISGGVVEKREDLLVTVAFFTPTAQGLDECRREVLKRLIPHFKRVSALNRQLAQQQSTLHSLQAVLDSAPFGVFRVGANGRLLACNRKGESLVQQGNGLVQRNGFLSAQSPDDAHLLNRAIARNAGSGSPDNGDPELVLVHRLDGRPLTVFCVPSPEHSGELPQQTVTVYAVDPEANATPPAALLRRLFQLTAAEARLALLIGQGVTVQDASDRLGISIHTGRTHLKHVLAKTDTRRQSDLVLLLSRLFTPQPHGCSSAADSS